MNKLIPDDSILRDRKILLGFFMIVIILFSWQIQRQNKVQKEGVYTIATIVEKSFGKSGRFLRIAYTFDGKNYNVGIRTTEKNVKIGNLYFVKILPKWPGGPVFQDGLAVPPCLRDVKPPPKGWKHIPSCIN